LYENTCIAGTFRITRRCTAQERMTERAHRRMRADAHQNMSAVPRFAATHQPEGPFGWSAAIAITQALEDSPRPSYGREQSVVAKRANARTHSMRRQAHPARDETLRVMKQVYGIECRLAARQEFYEAQHRRP
jgi:hypothetical protein